MSNISFCAPLLGAFYAVVSMMASVTPAHATPNGAVDGSRPVARALRVVSDRSRTTAERKHLDALERRVREAEADPARGLEFLDGVDELSAIYVQTHRLQELAWLESAYGDPQKTIRIERDIKLRLADEAIVHRQPLAKGVELVTLASGLRGVFRAFDRVAVQQSANGLESRGAIYDSRRFDVIAYEISRALGFALVPVTTMREQDKHLGVIQAYVADADHGDVDLTVNPYPHEQLWVFDYLTRQMDRHTGNYGVRPGGYVVAWDNNAIFDSNVAMDLRRRYEVAQRTWPTSFQMPIDLSAATLEKLRAFKDKLATNPDLIRHLGYGSTTDVFQRVETLLKSSSCGTYFTSSAANVAGPVDQPPRSR